MSTLNQTAVIGSAVDELPFSAIKILVDHSWAIQPREFRETPLSFTLLKQDGQKPWFSRSTVIVTKLKWSVFISSQKSTKRRYIIMGICERLREVQSHVNRGATEIMDTWIDGWVGACGGEMENAVAIVVESKIAVCGWEQHVTGWKKSGLRLGAIRNWVRKKQGWRSAAGSER